MLAITFTTIQLLLLWIPQASASPYTLIPINSRPQVASKWAAIASQSITTLSTPATPTTVALQDAPPAEGKQPDTAFPSPRPQQPRGEGTFAISLTTTSTKAAAIHTRTLEQAQAQTTAAPPDDPEADADLAHEGYSQVTYYSCEAYATTTLCGWHVPVVHVGGSAATERRAVGGAAVGWALAVGILVGRRW